MMFRSFMIKVTPLSEKARQAVREFGHLWSVEGEVTRPDSYFFRTQKPQLYIVPVITTWSADTTKNLGDNYKPTGHIANKGARWIDAVSDSDFSFEAA